MMRALSLTSVSMSKSSSVENPSFGVDPKILRVAAEYNPSELVALFDDNALVTFSHRFVGSGSERESYVGSEIQYTFIGNRDGLSIEERIPWADTSYLYSHLYLQSPSGISGWKAYLDTPDLSKEGQIRFFISYSSNLKNYFYLLEQVLLGKALLLECSALDYSFYTESTPRANSSSRVGLPFLTLDSSRVNLDSIKEAVQNG